MIKWLLNLMKEFVKEVDEDLTFETKQRKLYDDICQHYYEYEIHCRKTGKLQLIPFVKGEKFNIYSVDHRWFNTMTLMVDGIQLQIDFSLNSMVTKNSDINQFFEFVKKY